MADAAASAASAGLTNANVAKIAIEQRKKKTEVVEPQVIRDELLIEGVEEPIRPDGEPCDPIDFPHVIAMRLSFQNIIEVSNLNNFDRLTTLRLDNNIIDKIQNLGELKSLTWLDLSFNNIREIEGLDELGNLLDLSLYHNQIEEIKGLDGCLKLNILSLGHNNIKSLKQIDGLRKFTNLRCLCLEGNKMCQHDSYTQHVLAYLPDMKYLDYMLIDRKAVAQALEGYNLEDLTDVREREQSEATKQKATADKQAILARLKASFLDCTEDLFEEFFAKGVEPEHVTVLSNFNGLKETYREEITEEIKQLRAKIEEKNDDRLRKVAAFEKAVVAAERESESEAFNAIKEFKSLKKKALALIERTDDGTVTAAQKQTADTLLPQLQEQLKSLEHHLLANEVQVQESIEEAIGDFEVKVGEIIKVMQEDANEFFRKREEKEKLFYTQLIESANLEMDAFAQNQEMGLSDVDSSQKTRFLHSREDMTQAITNFYEAHMARLLEKDEAMQTEMTNWLNNYFKLQHEKQYFRNRQRITDTRKTVEENREEIRAAGEAGDDFDEQDGAGEFR